MANIEAKLCKKGLIIKRISCDSVVYDRLIPHQHLLVKIANEIDFSFIDEETMKLYSQRDRPSYPASLLFKMLFFGVSLQSFRCRGIQTMPV